MSLRDVTGIFSRSFVVGYFTPALAAWTTVTLLTRASQPARFTALGFQGQTIVVIACGAVVAGVLSGLRYEIRGVFAAATPLPRPLRKLLRAREERRFAVADELSRSESAQERTRGFFTLDQEFPERRTLVRPTRFGNVVGAYQAYPYSRYGLDYVVAWKRIDVLLSPREVELQALARSDVALLLNLSVLGIRVGLTLLVEPLVRLSPLAASSLAGFALSFASYRLAVRAERRLGHEQRASFDLHRLALYDQLGLRRPRSAEEERAAAAAVSGLMLWRDEEHPAGLYSAGVS